MMVKIAIIGSRGYTNKRKIKEFIFKLKEQVGGKLEIVSGGAKEGADKYAKRFALDFDIQSFQHTTNHTIFIVYWNHLDMVNNIMLVTTIEEIRI